MQIGEAGTQVEKVVLQLRQMVLEGKFAAGSHVAEIPLAERLGVSRTPVRLALNILEREGLVVSSPRRGFTVREVTIEEISDAFDVRGALEGMACRLVLERGLSRRARGDLEQCLDEADRVLAKGYFVEEDTRTWSGLNARFHGLIIAAAGNKPLAAALSFNNRTPMVAAGAIAFQAKFPDLGFQYMRQAHTEHLALFDALSKGQGARAEALAQEHAYKSRENLCGTLRQARQTRSEIAMPGLNLLVG